MSQIFYEYVLLEQLGRKKASALYLAQPADTADTVDATEDQVVIKAFDAINLRSDQQQNAFKQELTLFQQMDSPYILAPVDGGIEKNYPYIISAYLPTGSLYDRLKESSSLFYSIENSLHILLAIGRALSYAHSLNILHANIKPENVLFYPDGEPVLTDFRLNSLLVDSLPLLSRPDVRNACYMAPEQFAGLVSKESDQYALGCLAYELLTGRPPFSAAALSTWRTKHESEPPVPLTSLVAEIPAHIEAAVLRALSKDPVERYGSITDFMDAITNTSSEPHEHGLFAVVDDSSDTMAENIIIDSTVVSYTDASYTNATAFAPADGEDPPTLDVPPLNKYKVSGKSGSNEYADQYEGFGGEKLASHYARNSSATRYDYTVFEEDDLLEEDELLADEDGLPVDVSEVMAEEELLGEEDGLVEEADYGQMSKTTMASEYTVVEDALFTSADTDSDDPIFGASIPEAIPTMQMYNATDDMLATLDAQADVFFPDVLQDVPGQRGDVEEMEEMEGIPTLLTEQKPAQAATLPEGEQAAVSGESSTQVAGTPRKVLKTRNRGRWIAIVLLCIFIVVSLGWLLFGVQVYQSVQHTIHSVKNNIARPQKNGNTISIGLTPRPGATLTPGNVQAPLTTTSASPAGVTTAGQNAAPAAATATATIAAQSSRSDATAPGDHKHHPPAPTPPESSGPPSPQPTAPVVNPVPTTPVPATETPTPTPDIKLTSTPTPTSTSTAIFP